MVEGAHRIQSARAALPTAGPAPRSAWNSSTEKRSSTPTGIISRKPRLTANACRVEGPGFTVEVLEVRIISRKLRLTAYACRSRRRRPHP